MNLPHRRVIKSTSGPMRPRMRAADLSREALAGLLVRPGRAALTALGAMLGIAALVGTVGTAQTAGSQIVTHLDALTITEVSVEPRRDPNNEDRLLALLPWDSEERVSRLTGVAGAGTRSAVETDGRAVSTVAIRDPTRQNSHAIPIIATSPGLLEAVRGQVIAGRYFDAGHDERADPVAVLGAGAAERLGVNRVDHQPAIHLGERRLVVIGILGRLGRQHDLTNAVLVPNGYAREQLGVQAPDSVHIDTERGAVDAVAAQAPLALEPNTPDRLQVNVPPQARNMRSAVEAEVNALFLVLGGISLLIGALGIANVTLVSVLERVSEIGVRRALGAARRHIAAQFLFETTVIGLGGGVAGACVGVLTVVGIALVQGWTPVLDAWVPLAAPLVGAVTGLAAGVYPALKAASLEPLEALRIEG